MSEASPDRERDVFQPGSVEAVNGSGAILRATAGTGELSAAQRVNLATMTARGYEPLWRRWSISVLTLGGWTTAQELTSMKRWVEPEAGERILDAGCSAGLYARTLLDDEPDTTVHAVDVSLPFLREARRRGSSFGDALVPLQANVERLPYRDAVFDAVVSGGSLNEFRDPAAALRELARVVNPGGRLFLMYPCRARTRLGRLLQRMLEWSGLSFPTRSDVDGWARAAGLVEIRHELHRPVVVSLYRRHDRTTDQHSGDG